MSKYNPLKKFLQSSNENVIQLSFSQIEDILGFTLPDSARIHDAWWRAKDHTQAKAWLDSGYKVKLLRRKQEVVSFTRETNEDDCK